MVSNMNDQKCDACNRVENLKPCAYCGEPVTIRYNMMTDEHYISHDDLDSRCSQRPFFGSAEKWNASQTEDMLRGEIIKWIEAANVATKLINEQQRETLNLRQLLREAYEHLDTHDLGCPVGEGYGEPCRCGLPALRRRIEEAVGVAK